jgi:2-oxoglutarate ferredoxin oxidoreductase subunit gamma
MKERLVIAGFGGQGVLLAGVILANAGMIGGKEVSWLPSYGPEMRGGTANCQVTISDKPIGSPLIDVPDSLIVMNGPSLLKFEDKLKSGGLLLINSSLIGNISKREDVRKYFIPVNDIAIEIGNNKIANVVMLGAYIAASGMIGINEVEKAIMEVFGTKKPELIDINIRALSKGMEYIGGDHGNKNNENR